MVSRLNTALSSAIQHAMPPEFGRKWGTECLNTRFPLPTLLCAGYSVKLIFYKKLNVAGREPAAPLIPFLINYYSFLRVK